MKKIIFCLTAFLAISACSVNFRNLDRNIEGCKVYTVERGNITEKCDRVVK